MASGDTQLRVLCLRMIIGHYRNFLLTGEMMNALEDVVGHLVGCKLGCSCLVFGLNSKKMKALLKGSSFLF